MTHASVFLTTLSAFILMACAGDTTPENATPQKTHNFDLTLDYNTAPIDLSTPQATAYSMMIAMYRGDTDMIDKIFMPDGVLRRLRANGEINQNGLPAWRDWVGTLEVSQAHEQLFDIKVEQFGRLATVWAPFVIDVDNKRVGCGVNQFTMAKIDGTWRIVSGIDVQAPREECANFKEVYRHG